ncbi:cold-shock DNA-binding domain protein [Cooperia oncophora]
MLRFPRRKAFETAKFMSGGLVDDPFRGCESSGFAAIRMDRFNYPSLRRNLLGAYELSTMSTAPVEVAEEALEKKVEAMKIVDGNNMEVKKGTTTTDGKSERRERRFARMTDERRRIWEEEQMTKKVAETGLKDHVKWYSVLDHYGFISRADGKPDIFAHQSAISKSQTEKFYLRTLADEEEVEFDIVEGRKGPEHLM